MQCLADFDFRDNNVGDGRAALGLGFSDLRVVNRAGFTGGRLV